MDTPLITVSIPTLNSSKTLEKCLGAVFEQTYKNIEVNIVDRNSGDNTLAIAKTFGIKNVTNYRYSLLGARSEGLRMAKGKYILLLDSDQVLMKNTLERAVFMIENGNLDMLALEESAYYKRTLIEKILDLDKKLIHQVKDLKPTTGVILARFYRTDVLKRAFARIPKDLLLTLGGQDHAIIYYEAYQVSDSVKVLPKSLKHIEPNSLIRIVKKSFRWGLTSVDSHFGKYNLLIKSKERVRKGLFSKGLFVASLASILVMGIKWLPYKLGYFWGILTRRVVK